MLCSHRLFEFFELLFLRFELFPYFLRALFDNSLSQLLFDLPCQLAFLLRREFIGVRLPHRVGLSQHYLEFEVVRRRCGEIKNSVGEIALL